MKLRIATTFLLLAGMITGPAAYALPAGAEAADAAQNRNIRHGSQHALPDDGLWGDYADDEFVWGENIHRVSLGGVVTPPRLNPS